MSGLSLEQSAKLGHYLGGYSGRVCRSPHRLAVRTSPFHGENTGSNPVGDASFSSPLFKNFHSRGGNRIDDDDRLFSAFHGRAPLTVPGYFIPLRLLGEGPVEHVSFSAYAKYAHRPSLGRREVRQDCAQDRQPRRARGHVSL